MLSAFTRHRHHPFPPLIFGERGAQVEYGFNGMVDRFAHLTPNCDYDTRIQTGFFYKGNVVDVDGIVINQTLYGHMRAISPVNDHNILIPLQGVHNGIFRSRKLTAQGDQGYFIPANDRFFFETNLEGLAGSLIVKYDLGRMNGVLHAMSAGQLSLPAEDEVRHLALTSGNVNFKRMFIKLFSQIDDFEGDTELLRMSGFDDAFYRLLAMTLFPDFFLKRHLSTDEEKSARRSELMCVFDRYVEEHLDSPMTLSELEAVLGVSARSLQYACLKRHGCSPREYIRDRKLDLAFKRLRDRSESVKIANLAAELGFSSQSQFSKFFRQKFGILPSQVRSGSVT